MNDHLTDRGCPTEEVWMDYLDARVDGGLVADRGALSRHLEDCQACTQDLDELRRFNTILLRSRVPGLSDSQWSVLNERMDMMGSEYVPPAKVATRVYFGLAMAAAFGLFAVGVWHLTHEPSAAEMAIANAGRSPVDVAAAAPATLVAGVVDGEIEFADATGVWRPLSTGEALRPGARLRSVNGASESRLVVPGHFELRLDDASELQVVAANERATWLRVRKGGVACQVEKRRPNQQFKVLAGRFRASVVGTEFVVRYDRDDAAVSVRVTEGAVRVDEADDPEAGVSETTTLVRAGNRWKFVGGRIEFGPIQATTAPSAAAPTPSPETIAATVGAPNPGPANRKERTKRPVAKPRASGASADAVTAGPTLQPPPPTAAAPNPKFVEIMLPEQWHRKAHEVEVKRLEKLSTHSDKARDSSAINPKPAAANTNSAAGEK